MWKPTRLRLSKDIQDGIDRLMSNTAEWLNLFLLVCYH
jgi:hypothetical protein